MIVLPDVRGLHQYYTGSGLRFAEHGIDAVAIDYFRRDGRRRTIAARASTGCRTSSRPGPNRSGRHRRRRAICAPPRAGGPSALLGRLLLRRRAVASAGGERPRLRRRHRLLRLAARPAGSRPIARSRSTPSTASSPGPSRSTAAPIRGSRPRPIQQFDAASTRPPSRTRRTSMRARRTASSIARRPQYADASADAWEQVRAFVARNTPNVPAP